MPFWKKDSVKKGPVKQDSSDSSSTGVNGDGGKSKEKVDYKARLQHKQYLVSNVCKNNVSISKNNSYQLIVLIHFHFHFKAQESPEPLYDISDCGMKNVPSGVYIKVKMSLKEALLLQVNMVLCAIDYIALKNELDD